MDTNMDGPSTQQNCGTERLSSPGKTTLLENRATVAELVNEEAVVAEKSCDTIEEGRSKNSIPGPKMSFQEHVLIDEHGIRQRTSNDVTDKLLVFPLEEEAEKTSAEEMQISTENGIHRSHPETAAKSSRGRPRESSEKSTKGKHVLKSVDGTRVLRSRSQEKGKDPEPNNNLQGHSAGASGENGRKRKKKKKKQMKNIAVDEFSKTRTHLRYLLHRMAYEQNFIDAYAGEGWKGQSAEKLRPEKELQRAKSEIFRCKLKIRDLFQHIDLSIAEGRLPQSLFDSEGEIDSEDIFCSKCGLKDVTLNNDIILCDGACERAFHQFCVQPPLLKEDIPDDDEGWLCPGCDCKDDCLDLLNESQGTNLSILDSWEKVYPGAAAAAAAGKTLDNNLELPSDDSEDNDYKPDDSEVKEKDNGDESSSDESDIYSASEDSGVAPTNEQNLRLPSDDSEDDDFDPDVADVDEEVKQETSESDFTSDSEDLNLVVGANGSPHENLTMANEFMSEQSKVGRGKRPSLNDELASLLDTAPNLGKSAVMSARREVERLDYKKLFDEQYGNVSTDPSDEEYLDDADAPKRRRKNNTNSEKSLKRRGRKKLDTGGTNNSPIKSNKVPSESGSSNASAKTSAIRRLGEAATQGLLMSFKENQNPERASKEKLAEELGITTHQVTKWFANARWSFRHMPSFASKLADIPSMGTPAQIRQSDVRPDISAAVKSGKQSEEASDAKADMPIDNTKNISNSLEDQQKVEKRGRLKGRKSTKSTGNKSSSHLSSNNVPCNKDGQKSHGPSDVSNALVKKRRGRPKKSEI